MRHIYLLILMLALVSCGKKEKSSLLTASIVSDNNTTYDANLDSHWNFEKISDNNIIFKSGQSFKTNQFNILYIGKITTDNNEPYLIYAGSKCEDCKDSLKIHIESPSPNLKDRVTIECPGTHNFEVTKKPILKSETYYGEVLKGRKGVICFETKFEDKGKTKSSIHFYELKGNHLVHEDLFDPNTQEETYRLYELGVCKEIAPLF